MIGDVKGGMTVKELSKAAQGIRASTTMAIDAMFKQMRAEGQDVIGFAAGEPDFNTPDHIKKAAKQTKKQNNTTNTRLKRTIPVIHRRREHWICGRQYVCE